MYRKELRRFILGAVAMFVVVGAVGFFCVYSLRREAALAARDTLPGLINAGAANNLMEENLLRSLNLVELKTAEERNRCLDQIEAVSRQTEFYMNRYAESIFDAADRTNFERLAGDRRVYLEKRRQFFELVRKDQADEARQFFRSSVLPAYDRYNAAGSALFDYNVKIGEERSRRMLMLSRVTPVVVGFFGVVIFLTGALFGFKVTLP